MTSQGSPSSSGWAAHAGAAPGAVTVAALDAADPDAMPGADLIDAIVACERAISHLQATRTALTAAFARPGVAGDLTGLIETVTGKRGAARGSDGTIDPELLAAHQQDYARSLAATEIAAALHIPHRTASTRVAAACELVEQLPTTWEALSAGRLDERRATLIAKGTRCLPEQLRRAAEDVIVPLAQSRIPRHVQELLDRAVIAADPEAATRREQQARGERAVRHYPDRDGMGKVHAHLPAEGASAVYTLLDLLAQAVDDAPDADGNRRGIDARRADVMTDIFTELLATGRIDLTRYGQRLGDSGDSGDGDGDGDGQRSGDGDGDGQCSGDGDGQHSGDGDGSPAGDPIDSDHDARPAADPAPTSAGDERWRGLSRHGRRPHLTVTVGMSTLAGLDRLPGHLAGHGAISADLALSIAEAYQTLALAGIDEATGTAAAVTSTVYRPRQHLADQIGTLAGHCRFPSCRQPAWRSDHDHRVPFDHTDPESGGLTSLWDCDPECRRHHLLKTHAQWVAEGKPDRSIDWTSPTGHHYTTRPAEYRLPGENADPDIGDLILPATWPPPRPEPPPDDDADETAGPPECADDDDDAAPWRPSPAMRDYLHRLNEHNRQMDRFRTVAHRLRRVVGVHASGAHPSGAHASGAHPTGGCPDGNHTTSAHPDSRPGRPSRLNHRDHAARARIDRTMRRAAGLPDPNDEPPPF